MSVAPGTFANQAPDSGSIRVFYQTINNKDVVKAITVSDVDKDGDDISISLTELDTITLPLSASGQNVELVINSIKQKSGYHFLDVDDITVNTLSGSVNSSIAIAPYLTETFFYNDYNATISNAEKTRRSYIRYDVDRSGGQTKPTNYNAVAGIGTLTVSGLEYIDGDGNTSDSAENIGYTLLATAQGNSLGFLTSSAISIKDDEDFTFRVGPQELNAAIGFPQKPVVSVSKLFLENDGILKVSSSLNLKLSSNADFNTSSGQNNTMFLAEQLYENGIVVSRTFTPSTSGVSLRIPSGSYGGTIYIRLEQVNTITASSDVSQTITTTSILKNNPQSDDFIKINVHRDPDEEAIPYAPKAPVQDSNYTSTGIVNARYRGTKTTSGDYSGIEPAITAQPFSAAVYRLEESDNFICSQSLSDRQIEDFLFIGTDDSPGANAETLGVIHASEVLTSSTDTVFNLALDNISIFQTIKPGDVLNITDNTNSEIVQVVQAQTTSNFGVMEITVTRDYNSLSSNYTFAANASVSRFSDTRIFKLEGNRLIALTEKKIWVKDNRTVLKTSQSGYVIQLSTTCTV